MEKRLKTSDLLLGHLESVAAAPMKRFPVKTPIPTAG
jgi:hypothetical protein